MADGDRPAWTEQLADDLKGHEGLTRFETLTDLGKAYVDLEGKAKNSVQLLGENPSDEERATFFNQLGRPEAPEGYELKRPDLPEGINYSEEDEKAFRQFAHEQGLTNAQAKSIFDLYHSRVTDTYQKLEQARKEAREQAETRLKGEWGDKYDGNVELAKRAVRHFGDEDFNRFLDASGFGDNPALIKVFHKIAQAVSEDLIEAGATSPGGKQGPERTDGGTPMLSFPSMEK